MEDDSDLTSTLKWHYITLSHYDLSQVISSGTIFTTLKMFRGCVINLLNSAYLINGRCQLINPQLFKGPIP